MFNLTQAIGQWRRKIQAGQAIEDGDLAELEGHLMDKIEDLIARGMKEEEAFRAAEAEFGRSKDLDADFFRARSRREGARPSWRRWRFVPPLIASYIKIALRKIERQKVYALINIAGLSVGLACCTVIILYVTNELSYDTFHPDSRRLYRIATHRIHQVGEDRSSTTPGPLGPELLRSYPQIERAVRVVAPYENAGHVLVVSGEKRFFENRVWFVDRDIYQVFRLPFLQGRPQTSLEKPNAAVITEGTARKYFGKESPLGQTLQIEIDYDTGSTELQDYEVTGVVKDSPANTHFKYDLLLSMPTLLQNVPSFEEDWLEYHAKYTYVKLSPTAEAVDFEKQIQRAASIVYQKYEEARSRKMELFEFFLQPLSRIHMDSRLGEEMEPPGNWYYIYIYSAVALLILLVGCMNFVNLSIALSATRTREVGLRKVVGASRGYLVGQFLGESFLITLLAFCLSFGLVYSLLFPFNRMAGTELSLDGLTQPAVLAALAGLLFAVSLGSGFYPAFVLTAFKPVSILQGRLAPASRGTLMQTLLVVGQFAVSIFLVICTLTVGQQLNFMRGRALGFDLEQKLVLRVKSNLSRLRRDYETIKNSFLQNPAITGATVSSSVPGDPADAGYYLTTRPGDFKNAARLKVITVDYNFIPEFKIKMVAGRAFQRGLGNDENEAYLINLAGVKELGFSSPQEALEKSYMAHYHRMTKRIIGVTDDFHYRGMQTAVEPLILDIESSLMDTITLSVRMGSPNDLLGFVRRVWDEHFPGVPFEYSFLDEDFDRQYRYEKQMGHLLGITTTLGLIVACLGLFGMASFIARRREKEIGIRKVLGASTHDIVAILAGRFVRLIGLAAVIASPLALYSMNTWLRDFAYRVHMDAAIFLAAAFGALAIALLTVGLQGFRAAVANPADSLRNE